jgi:hypothetical protein
MMDYLEIAAGPADEQVEQANLPTTNYERMREECRAFVEQLRRQFGEEPEGARLVVKRMPYGMESYYEVVCYYDRNQPASIDYAFKLERETPEKWDAEARRVLTLSR